MRNLKSSNPKSGKALVGLIILGIGCILLLRTLDIFFIPFWPLLIIGFGLWMILGRKKTKSSDVSEWEKRVDPDGDGWTEANGKQPGVKPGSFAEDKVESVSIFGGIKKNIVSKNFQGGEIVNFFGGAELNLMQSDINGRVELEVVQVFGGTKIIVPSNWTVHSEMVAIFGGIEDKRPAQLNAAPDKVLVIQGTSIFGGIDIRSF